MTRNLVVCDVETNGLDLEKHQVVEVAWWNLTTNERDTFVPYHNVHMVLHDAEIAALRVNRYLDRIVDRVPERAGTMPELAALYLQLADATMIGSNPAFDAGMLSKLFRAHYTAARNPTPWHYRLWDVSAYAAGVLDLDELPGLHRICDLLDIEPGDHTAEGDVTATGLCFQELRKRATP